MDLRLIAPTFTTLFLAELGDKTQLAVLSLTASSKQPLAVFIGAACALLAVTAIGVLVGEGLSRVVPAWLLQKAAAVAFIAIGLVMFVGKSS
jgi:putative Ca2+/H+ antiporter (TMEM165/GDT1 family)